MHSTKKFGIILQDFMEVHTFPANGAQSEIPPLSPLSTPPFTDSLLQDGVSPLLSRGLLHYHLTTKAAAAGHTQNSARLWAGL